MEPFENLLDPALVPPAAGHLQRVHPDVDAARIKRLATQGLEAPEMKAVSLHIFIG